MGASVVSGCDTVPAVELCERIPDAIATSVAVLWPEEGIFPLRTAPNRCGSRRRSRSSSRGTPCANGTYTGNRSIWVAPGQNKSLAGTAVGRSESQIV